MEPMVDVLNRVGASLQAEYGHVPIPSRRIRDEVERIRGQKPGAGCPADLCYNRRKDGIPFPNDPMFVFLYDGHYLYIGMGQPYSGPVLHRPKSGFPEQVGYWINGRYYPLV